MLSQYNLSVPEPANIFTIGKNNFSTIDGEVFFNDKPIFLAEEDLLGASQNQDTFILASSSIITVISKEGYIINKENALPFTIKNIGINEDEMVINDSEDKIWSSESINGVWKLIENMNVQWSKEGSITTINQEKIRKYFVGDGVSLEQVILDFHSGAIFQKAGKLFFDIISILLIILSFTGIWLWTIKRKY